MGVTARVIASTVGNVNQAPYQSNSPTTNVSLEMKKIPRTPGTKRGNSVTDIKLPEVRGVFIEESKFNKMIVSDWFGYIFPADLLTLEGCSSTGVLAHVCRPWREACWKKVEVH